MTAKKDVKQSTIDIMTKRGVDSGLKPEQAKKVAIESAERLNARRREGK